MHPAISAANGSAKERSEGGLVRCLSSFKPSWSGGIFTRIGLMKRDARFFCTCFEFPPSSFPNAVLSHEVHGSTRARYDGIPMAHASLAKLCDKLFFPNPE